MTIRYSNSLFLAILDPKPQGYIGWDIVVVSRSDWQTRLAVFPQFGELQFSKVLSEEGQGSVLMPYDMPQFTAPLPIAEPFGLLEAEHLWQVWHNNRLRFEFFVEDIDDEVIMPNGKRGLKLNGRGTAKILRHARVKPAGYPGPFTSLDREFSGPLMGTWVTLFNEAKAQGIVPMVDLNFTATVDGSGTPWNDISDVVVKAGDNLYDLLVKYTSTLGIEWQMRPGFLLDARQSYGFQRQESVVFHVGHAVESVKQHKRRRDIANYVYTEDSEGGVSQTINADSAARWGIRDAWTSSGDAASDATRSQYATAYLRLYKDEIRGFDVTVPPRVDGRIPFQDWDVGDWVGFDIVEEDLPQSLRVVAATIKVDSNAKETLEITVESKIDTYRRRLQSILDNLGGNQVQSSTSTEINQQRFVTSLVDALTFDDLADVNMLGKVDGSFPAWDQATGKYIPGVPAGSFQGNWSALVTYLPGSIVIHNGMHYGTVNGEDAGDEPGIAGTWMALGGGGGAGSASAALVERTTNQAISATTDTVVTWTGVRWQTGTVTVVAGTGVFTVSSAGVYLATGHYEFDAQEGVRMLVRVNGGVWQDTWLARDNTYEANRATVGATLPLLLSANDTVEFGIFTDSAANLRGGVRSWAALIGTGGEKGDTGDPGLDGSIWVYRGEWSAVTAYVIDDVVSYQGSSYVAVATSTNVTPPAAQWQVVAAKGADGASRHAIQDEGSALTDRPTLDFVGSGVTITDDSGNNKTVVTIGQSGHTIMDEGSPLTTRAGLDFVGEAVTVTDDLANNKTVVTVSAPTSTTSSVWNWLSASQAGSVATGRVGVNNDAPASATAVHMAATDKNGFDRAPFIKNLHAGDSVFIWQKSNTANNIRYEVTADPTDNTTWFSIPVTAVAGGGTEPGNNEDVVIVFMYAGAGGASALDDLTDVVITNPLDEHHLVYEVTAPTYTPTTNVVTGATITSNGTGWGTPATLATNDGSNHRLDGSGNWVQWDFGTAKRLCAVQRETHPTKYATSITIQYSDNGTSWTTLQTFTGLTTGTHTLNFTDITQSHRYWRYYWNTATDNDELDYMWFFETTYSVGSEQWVNKALPVVDLAGTEHYVQDTMPSWADGDLWTAPNEEAGAGGYIAAADGTTILTFATDTTFGSAAVVKIPFDTAYVDSLGAADLVNSQFVAPVGGTYILAFQWSTRTTGFGTDRGVWPRVNGVEQLRFGTIAGTTFSRGHSTWAMTLAEGDTVDVVIDASQAGTMGGIAGSALPCYAILTLAGSLSLVTGSFDAGLTLPLTRTWDANEYDGVLDAIGRARGLAVNAPWGIAHPSSTAVYGTHSNVPPTGTVETAYMVAITESSVYNSDANNNGNAAAERDGGTTSWHSSTQSNEWLKVDFGSGKKMTVTRYGMVGPNNRNPRNFKLQGSNDNTNWTDLLTVTNDGPVGAGWWSSAVTGAAGYRYIRHLNTGVETQGGQYGNIAEIEFWGTLAVG